MIQFIRTPWSVVRATWPILLAASLLVFALAPAEVAPPAPQPAPAVVQAAGSDAVDAPVVVLTLDDSNGIHGDWQAEFCRQLSISAGKVCDLRNEAVSGVGCGYWPSRIGALLAEHDPDLVILSCGTNDDATGPGGTTAVGTAFRQVVEAVHTWRSPPIPIAPVLLQYSDPNLAPAWVLRSTGPINDELYRNIQLYVNSPGWMPGIVDWQGIPATAYYLLGGPGEVGIHRNARAQRDAGRIAYDRIAPGMSWAASPEPPPCGMVGHRAPYPRPQVPLCPMGV